MCQKSHNEDIIENRKLSKKIHTSQKTTSFTIYQYYFCCLTKYQCEFLCSFSIEFVNLMVQVFME